MQAIGTAGRHIGGARARHAAGFTFIELMLVVAVVGVLALGLVPLGELAVQRSREHDLRAALRELRTALDAYRAAVEDGRILRKADESGYPPSLDVLVRGVDNVKPEGPKKLVFLRRIPRDPFFPDATTPAERTWGLRGYDSPPDSPRPGKDVFDVHSLSERRGLNGVPYRQW
ncbi:MAG: type II secretion system GspH family protein [Burkholderiales bacterium]|jgi:general secretion pathway protein G|nr:type II secretion system GspH family protein [Burkholderiales bacterium]